MHALVERLDVAPEGRLVEAEELEQAAVPAEVVLDQVPHERTDARRVDGQAPRHAVALGVEGRRRTCGHGLGGVASGLVGVVRGTAVGQRPLPLRSIRRAHRLEAPATGCHTRGHRRVPFTCGVGVPPVGGRRRGRPSTRAGPRGAAPPGRGTTARPRGCPRAPPSRKSPQCAHAVAAHLGGVGVDRPRGGRDETGHISFSTTPLAITAR